MRKMNKKQSEEQVKETFEFEDEEVSDNGENEKDMDINITISEQNDKETKQNRLKLDNFARECDRYGVPDRQAAALANALFVDIGFIEPFSEAVDSESKNVIDKNKVRRERERIRRECKNKKTVETQGGIKCFGFDGKRDRKTLIQKEIVGEDGTEKIVQERGVEEHIAYTAEGEFGGTYLTHSTIPPNKGTGSDLAEDFKEIIIDFGSEDCVEAIVCDGTKVRITLHSILYHKVLILLFLVGEHRLAWWRFSHSGETPWQTSSLADLFSPWQRVTTEVRFTFIHFNLFLF